MSVELWYKPYGESSVPCKVVGTVVYISNECPGTQSKNGYHIVVGPGDLPTTKEDGISHKNALRGDLEAARSYINGCLGILSRNDSRPVVTGNDLPKLSVPGETGRRQKIPSTLQEVRSLPFLIGTESLGKAVCRLRAAGCVTNLQCLTLLQRLNVLAQEYDTLHQALRYIPDDALRRADGEEVERK